MALAQLITACGFGALIVQRTRAGPGPVHTVDGPSDFGEILKPFVFLTLRP